MVATIGDDPNRHRYKLAHKIVRANSLGDWDDVLAELCTGTPVQHLRPGTASIQQELAASFGVGSWMHEAVEGLHRSIRTFVPDAEPIPVRFVNALVHIAELRDAGLPTISGAVNTFNSVNRELESDPDQKRAFARRLAAVMSPKIEDGDADDCSRLAWLYMQLGNRARAREIVRCGLALDPQNEHCRKLEARLATEIGPEPPA